jgi:hypothetical protein
VLGHDPQSRLPLQPSGIDPQVAIFAEQVVGLHPHWFAVPPPPHVSGAVHPPQSIVSPQPFEMAPHAPLHTLGTHASPPPPASACPPSLPIVLPSDVDESWCCAASLVLPPST